jgi:two-component system cell cycle sensor histidine kinase/response regulator CckA
LVVDRRGRVVGSNPSARFMTGEEEPGTGNLSTWYPCLTGNDTTTLLDQSRPHEVERTFRAGEKVRTLRFRSEPAEGVHQILVCDVTDKRVRELQDRQATHNQLIGRMARGVAYDFNTILCAIAGHAALLRQGAEPDGGAASLEAIVQASERGSKLARQLVDLSRTGTRSRPTAHLTEHLNEAVGLLQVALPAPWFVHADIDGTYPSVPFSGPQVEQLVMNLGLLAADALEEPGVLNLWMREPGASGCEGLAAGCAAVLAVWAHDEQGAQPPAEWVLSEPSADPERGVILSVLKTLIEEAGGRLDLCETMGRGQGFRLCLPRQDVLHTRQADMAGIPGDLVSQLAEWTVLLACPRMEEREELIRRMRVFGVQVESAEGITEALSLVEEPGKVYTGIVLDRDVLGAETEGLLRAILKLQPATALVLLDEAPEWIPASLREEVVFTSGTARPEAVFQALVRARERAGVRVEQVALAG